MHAVLYGTMADKHLAALKIAGVGLFELSSEEGLLVDDTFLTLLGYARSDVGSDPAAWFLALVHPDDVAQVRDDHRALLEGSRSQCQGELRLRTASGSHVWVRHAAHTIQARVVATVQIATELRALNNLVATERARMAAVAENMPLGLASFQLDPAAPDELVLKRANAAARAITPLYARLGSKASEMFPNASTEDFRKRANVARGEAAFTESKRRYVDGTIRGAFDTTFFNTAPGEVTGIFHDVTDHVRTEDSLRRSLENLDQFAYGIAHDLQEPARMVHAFAELLEHELGAVPAPADQYLDFLREGAARLKSLIQDLLAYARVGQHRNADTVDTHAELSAAIRDLGPVVAELDAEIVDEGLPVVRGSREELRQVFFNLLENALKFCGTSPPRIEVRASRRDEYEWEFCIEDNGIGIDEHDFDVTLRLFGRLHDRKHYAGNGVGLAVCKRIIEQHGGSIWLRSTPGAGSAVHFTLPAA